MSLIRVLGNRFRFFHSNVGPVQSHIFDRQVRAFGEDMQRNLQNLHIGVVGAGGIGSSVIEQFIRLGVGELSVWDPDVFSIHNVNRVYGSRVNDAWKPKTEIVARQGERIGLGTKFNLFRSTIAFRQAAEKLRHCDVVFGCTDDHHGRSILNKLALFYYIPVLDSAVEIDSQNGTIRSIIGRVTNLFPGNACLRCRGRIDPNQANAEALWLTDRNEYDRLRKVGYVPELGTVAPAVISFTTAVATTAINDFLQRLTGFAGDCRHSEILNLFHEFEIRLNRRVPGETCFCTAPKFWGKGDSKRFLEVLWPD
jgi:molybdopterin/thiamine biosynthesis adenylyltransferase